MKTRIVNAVVNFLFGFIIVWILQNVFPIIWGILIDLISLVLTFLTWILTSIWNLILRVLKLRKYQVEITKDDGTVLHGTFTERELRAHGIYPAK